MKRVWHFLVFLPVPVITVLAMWWDRMVHNVTSSPQPWERTLADAIWYGSLLALAAVPVMLNLLGKAGAWTHPVILDLLLASAAGLYLVGVIGWGWPMWPEILNSDLELVGGTYLVSAVAFSLALYEAISSFRAHTRRLTVGSTGVVLVCGAVTFVSSTCWSSLNKWQRPNPRLQRTRAAPSPLSRKPLGGTCGPVFELILRGRAHGRLSGIARLPQR